MCIVALEWGKTVLVRWWWEEKKEREDTQVREDVPVRRGLGWGDEKTTITSCHVTIVMTVFFFVDNGPGQIGFLISLFGLGKLGAIGLLPRPPTNFS